MLEKLCVKTGKRGRPRKRPLQLAAEKRYDSKELRNKLREKGIRPEIPKRVWKNRCKPAARLLVKRVQRFVVERSFSWLQCKFRRLVVRWERLPHAFQGFVSLAVSFMWLRRLVVG
jgi:transposase